MVIKIIKPDFRLLGLALLATAALFAPSLKYPFLCEWDDSGVIFNGHLAFSLANLHYWLTHNVQGLFTPVHMYSLMSDYNLAGPQPWCFRVHNLLLHLAAVAAFFLLLRHFRLAPIAAFWVTLFFAVSPQRIESVAWITERKDVLYGSCVLWSA